MNSAFKGLKFEVTSPAFSLTFYCEEVSHQSMPEAELEDAIPQDPQDLQSPPKDLPPESGMEGE